MFGLELISNLLNSESAPKSRVFEMVGKIAKFYSGGMYSVQLLSLLRKVGSSGLFLRPQNFIWILYGN